LAEFHLQAIPRLSTGSQLLGTVRLREGDSLRRPHGLGLLGLGVSTAAPMEMGEFAIGLRRLEAAR